MSVLANSDEYFMKQAMKQAEIALEEGEVPVGAVVVWKDQIIARAYNQTERLKDVTAHAEMLAITSASESIGGKYLNECKLYVTLEPCMMCAGALYWSRVGTIIYGAKDNRHGVLVNKKAVIHPKSKVLSGLLEAECAYFLETFFKKKRENRL